MTVLNCPSVVNEDGEFESVSILVAHCLLLCLSYSVGLLMELTVASPNVMLFWDCGLLLCC